MYILVLICTDNKLKMYDAPFIHKFKTHYNGTLGTIEEFFFTVFVLRGTDDCKICNVVLCTILHILQSSVPSNTKTVKKNAQWLQNYRNKCIYIINI